MPVTPAAAEFEPTGPTNGPSGVCWERAGCAVCGAPDNRFVVEVSNLIYDRPGSVRIVRCGACGHLYQDPRPTRETIGLCYPDNYGPHVETSARNDESPPRAPVGTPWYLSSLARGIPGLRAVYYWMSDTYSEFVPRPPREGARALEFGCGGGRYLTKLVAAGWQAEGIEPAAEPARRCRERGLAVQAGTFESANFPHATYDLIVAWMVVEHLHDPGAALRKIHRLLRPGGTFLFSVPNIACWETPFFGRYYFIFNEPTHLQHFSPRTLGRLLAQQGFSRNRIHFQQNLYNVLGSLGVWLQSTFPHRRTGRRLLDFCDNPTMWGRLTLAPTAKLLAALRQAGRMTIFAQPDDLQTAKESPARAVAGRSA